MQIASSHSTKAKGLCPPHAPTAGRGGKPESSRPAGDSVHRSSRGGRPSSVMARATSDVPSNPRAAAGATRAQANAAASITQTGGDQQACDLKPAELTSKGTSTFASGVTVGLEKLGRNGGRLGTKLGVFGPAAGVAGELLALPGNHKSMTSSIGTAMMSGERDDVAKGVADTGSFASGATALVKGSLELPGSILRHRATHSARKAFKGAAPNAPRKVVSAAARTAAEEALKETATKRAGQAVTKSAHLAAKQSGRTVAAGTGAAGRQAAKAILREGGQAAAEAAGKAVAKGALKSVAKAGARFVPGMNVAIAAMDTATAVATLADKRSSPGKRATAVITAAGSCLAATNIPFFSQGGAVISAASSFVGAFFPQ